MSQFYKLKYPSSFWRRARARDATALASLFDYETGAVWRVIKEYILFSLKRKYFNTSLDIDDLIQTVIIKFWQALHNAGFDPGNNAGDALPYIIEIAKNAFKDYFREKSARKRSLVNGYYPFASVPLFTSHYSNYFAKKLFNTGCNSHARTAPEIARDNLLCCSIDIYLNLVNSLLRDCDGNHNGEIPPYR